MPNDAADVNPIDVRPGQGVTVAQVYVYRSPFVGLHDIHHEVMPLQASFKIEDSMKTGSRPSTSRMN